MAVDDKFRRSAAGRDAVDALEAELARPLDAIDRHAAIPGIAEIDRAARMHTDIVRAVKLLILEMRGDHLAPSIGTLADQGRGGMLADDQVEFGVIGHAVALVRRTLDLDDAAPGVPSPADIARHVGEQQIVMDRMPDRAFREVKTRADLADRRVGVDQGFEFRAQRDVRHRSVLFFGAQAGNQLRCGRLCTTGPGTWSCSRPTTTPPSILAGRSWTGSK